MQRGGACLKQAVTARACSATSSAFRPGNHKTRGVRLLRGSPAADLTADLFTAAAEDIILAARPRGGIRSGAAVDDQTMARAHCEAAFAGLVRARCRGADGVPCGLGRAGIRMRVLGKRPAAEDGGDGEVTAAEWLESNSIKRRTSVKLLAPEAAAAHVKKHHMEFIKRVGASKENVKRRSWNDFDSFVRHFKAWRPEHRAALESAVATVCSDLPAEWAWLADTSVPWIFLHGSVNLEGGMSHTVGNGIVLPEELVESAVTKGVGEPCRKAAPGSCAYQRLLHDVLHERIHVLQKLRPEPWARLYREWGWTRLGFDRAAMWMPLSAQVKAASGFEGVKVKFPQHRLNPDTPWPWVMRRRDEGTDVLWIPITPFATAGKTLGDVAQGFLRVHQRGPTSKAYGSATWHSRLDTEWFQQHISGGDQAAADACMECYQPEETAAVLVTGECLHASKRKHQTPALDVLRKWGETGARSP